MNWESPPNMARSSRSSAFRSCPALLKAATLPRLDIDGSDIDGSCCSERCWGGCDWGFVRFWESDHSGECALNFAALLHHAAIALASAIRCLMRARADAMMCSISHSQDSHCLHITPRSSHSQQLPGPPKS